ncbi:MAG TPA: hypothetical protein VHA56_16960 [Mucilaginibacter sp.]|nr:hypothetical protein [Mucilaginibacter sp.]
MRKFIFILGFCLLFTVLKAQDAYQPGFIILNNGTRIAGSIRLNNSEPWFNQRRIWFKDSAAMAADPNVKSKKYKADDLKFYQVGERKFEKVHYVDYENLQLKSMGSNDHMLEKLSDGRINSYCFYQYPKDFDAYYGTEEGLEQYKQKQKNDLLMGYKILAKKDNESKFHDALDYDMQKYLEDNHDVWEKYKAGGYGNQPLTKKKGLMAKMIATAKKTAFKQEEADAIVAAFNDYNAGNATK